MTAYEPHHLAAAQAWDRTLTVTSIGSARGKLGRVLAGGVNAEIQEEFAAKITEIINNSKSIHYLSLDADRAYPKIKIETHELGAAFERDWESTLKQSSFRITRNLYDEWFRYLMGIENKNNNEHIQAIRLARDNNGPDPYFVDKLATYKNSLIKVLPHLRFLGIDSSNREVKFDSTGLPLSFNQLSGGEREIAFLVGQIERFSLKKGLLLVDEPELHLNYDLLRKWIGYLKASVEEGQIWLATHSLEVVEVAGKDATFVLQRDEINRKVKNANLLRSQPIISTLSRAIGSPAFSISDLVFVFIEGEEEIGERERFRRICQNLQHIRFMEAGSCNDVIRKIEGLKDIAQMSDQEIRIGGVIDGDWRTPTEKKEFEEKGLFVLPVHEVENLFLHPATLQDWLNLHGRGEIEIGSLILAAADQRAGSWIFDAARTQKIFREFPEPPKATRTLVHRLTWTDFADIEHQCTEIVSSYLDLNSEQQELLQKHLVARAKIYSRYRSDNKMWRVCEGKEVFRLIAKDLGFSNENVAETAIIASWAKYPALVPTELKALRKFISAL